jgi:hypothetical protein
VRTRTIDQAEVLLGGLRDYGLQVLQHLRTRLRLGETPVADGLSL